MEQLALTLKAIPANIAGLGDVALAFFPTVIRIFLILLLAKIVIRSGFKVISRGFSYEEKRRGVDPKKAKTMEQLSKSLLRYAVYFIAALIILPLFGIRTESLVASAGIVGLAIGFGAQALVSDVLTGLFVIFEDQFAVGEYIDTGKGSGYVEDIGIRVTKLRDFSGVLHQIPHSAIGTVTNHSRGNSRAMVDISVAYEEDIERVTAVLEQTMAEVAAKHQTIVEGPKVLGISDLGPTEMVFRLWARTLPMEQWAIERAIRKEVRLAFEREGIEIPYPRVVHIPFSRRKE